MGFLRVFYWFWYVIFAINFIVFTLKLIFYPQQFTPFLYKYLFFCFLYTISPLLYFSRDFFIDFISSIKIKGFQLNEYKLGAFIFAVVGIFLLYIFFIGHSNKQDEFSFTVKPNRPMPNFVCKANTFYEIKTEQGIYRLNVNNNGYEVPDLKRYIVVFDEDTNLRVAPFTDGIWFKSAEIEIKKLPAEPSIDNSGVLVFITPNKYSNYSLPVSRGMKLDLKQQCDLFYLGEFINDKLLNEILIRKDDFSMRFTDNRIIKFKAAEVPLFLYINNKPFKEKLVVNGKVIGDALHLMPGDIIKTDVWVDKGDHVTFDKQYNSFGCWLTDRLLFSSGNSDWHELSGFSFKYFEALEDGYISIKCLQQTTIDFMKIERKNIELNLQQNELVKIPVVPGDRYEITSSSRFYLNGKLYDADIIYRYTTSSDSMEIKASVDPRTIIIKVLQRKGI